jgi:hypothetical protein
MIDEESLSCPPEGGALKRQLLGYLVPAVIALYAIVYGMIIGHIILPIDESKGALTGNAARWLGIAYLAVASFMHCHFGWGLSSTLWPYSQKGKWISVYFFAPSLVIALYLH